MPASLAEQLYARWRELLPADSIWTAWATLDPQYRAAWERVAEAARDLCQPAIVGYRCVCGIDHVFETREAAIEQLTKERDELIAYIDAAKHAAGARRVSGEPLASFIERLIAESDQEAWK